MPNRIEVERNRCKGCGLCVDSCPKKIIRLASAINLKGYHYAEQFDPAKCIACKMCAVTCPDVAIYVFKGNKKAKEA